MPRMQLRLLNFQLHVKLAGPSCIPKFCQWLTLQNRQTLFSYMEKKEECFLSWKQFLKTYLEKSSGALINGPAEPSQWPTATQESGSGAATYSPFSPTFWLFCSSRVLIRHLTEPTPFTNLAENLYDKRIKANCLLLDLQLNWLSEGFAKSQNWSKGGHQTIQPRTGKGRRKTRTLLGSTKLLQECSFFTNQYCEIGVSQMHAINHTFISGNVTTVQIMDPSNDLIYCGWSYFRAYGCSSDINSFLFHPVSRVN